MPLLFKVRVTNCVRDEAIAEYEVELAAQTGPFTGMDEKKLTACFRLLTTTISTELDFLIMNFLPHQFEEAWYSVRDYFQSNTRGARMDAKILFFTMSMAKFLMDAKILFFTMSIS